jgi:LmbE family N-acetylglucosaminyl deacetylase
MAGIPSGPLLLVSPHLDDAVFSCSAVVERAEAVDVLTVCAGSPDPPRRGWWDEDTGFSSSAESMPARLREDEEAFAGTPHRRSYLSLLELQYVDGARSDDERRTIAAAVGSWVSENQSATVALPAGAGCRSRPLVRRLLRLLSRPCHPPRHPDHLFVRDAVLPVLRDKPEAKVLLYEELPYLLGGSADREAQRVAAGGGWDAEPIVRAIDRSAKAARIAAYSSQVLPLSPPEGRLDDAAALPAEERYWLLRRSSTSP